jgi:hypothetical protein
MKMRTLLTAVVTLAMLGMAEAQQSIRENPSNERDHRMNSSYDAIDFTAKLKTRKNSAIAIIGPSKSTRGAFKDFLKQSKTGITRLVIPEPCAMSFKDRILNRDKFAKDCPSEFMVGNGAHFSFRKNDYVFSSQADISLFDKIIYSSGAFSQGLLVSLGDIPITELSLQSDGVSFLNDYVPATTILQADEQYARINKGITDRNFLFTRGLKFEQNRTYAIRVIAYRSDKKIPIALSEEERKQILTGLRSDSDRVILDPTIADEELSNKSDLFYRDERKDIIVVFRIVDVDEQGGVTMIWKELKRSESPKL